MKKFKDERAFVRVLINQFLLQGFHVIDLQDVLKNGIPDICVELPEKICWVEAKKVKTLNQRIGIRAGQDFFFRDTPSKGIIVACTDDSKIVCWDKRFAKDLKTKKGGDVDHLAFDSFEAFVNYVKKF